MKIKRLTIQIFPDRTDVANVTEIEAKETAKNYICRSGGGFYGRMMMPKTELNTHVIHSYSKSSFVAVLFYTIPDEAALNITIESVNRVLYAEQLAYSRMYETGKAIANSLIQKQQS